MTLYYRPLAQTDTSRPTDALQIAGGWTWATHVEVLSRNAAPRVMSVAEIPGDVSKRLTNPRAAIGGISMSTPQVMGIVNTTPDSFSDGGLHAAHDAAVEGARKMVRQGVDILDIGGESTRPGATEVVIAEEIERTAPVIETLRACDVTTPISIDTRKSKVAEAAFTAGATILNDVSGFDFDPAMASWCAQAQAPVCLMHAQGTPDEMQNNPHYSDVVLDVYDALEARVTRAEAKGIPRGQILVDPGIGFGKTQSHNLSLLRAISVFHGLGCPLLLGVSRKRFIGDIGGADFPPDRMPGSLAVGLAAVAQGVQVLRVHDVAETLQGLALWRAVTSDERD